VLNAIEDGYDALQENPVRLVMEDVSCHSRFSFVVHTPVAQAA